MISVNIRLRISWLNSSISTKFGGRVYYLLFNSLVKFHAKNLHALLKYKQKLQGLLFILTLYVFCSKSYIHVAWNNCLLIGEPGLLDSQDPHWLCPWLATDRLWHKKTFSSTHIYTWPTLQWKVRLLRHPAHCVAVPLPQCWQLVCTFTWSPVVILIITSITAHTAI